MPAHAETPMTADELLDVEIPGKWTELVRGHLVVREPPSTLHGKVAARLTYELGLFVYGNKLGILCSQDTGFKVASNPDTVRAPDLAFLSNQQASKVGMRGYATLTPALVVEVVSPGDRPGELLARAGEWLEAGAGLVWVIDPLRGEAHVHRPDGSLTVVGMDAALDGEAVLPGFSCLLADVLS